MSITDCTTAPSARGFRELESSASARALHRLHKVRRREGLSRRTVARRLNANVSAVKLQEDESSDIRLSTLYQWQGVLQVPVGELLVEANDGLSPPVLRRAQLLRVMKTGMAILERAQQAGIRRMAQTLVDQLVDLMPELREVKPWPSVGKRRTQNELGQAAGRRLSPSALADLVDGD